MNYCYVLKYIKENSSRKRSVDIVLNGKNEKGTDFDYVDINKLKFMTRIIFKRIHKLQ